MKKYITAIQGSAIALVSFTLLAFILPSHETTGEVELVLTVSTFLFAILAGFLISRLSDRYNTMRNLVGQEDAHWLSLYRMGKLYGKKFSNELADRIDDYYTTIFDYELGEYYKQSREQLENVYALFYKTKLNERQYNKDVFDDMLGTLSNIEGTRNLSSVLAVEKLNTSQWITISSLGAIILFCLFYLNGNQLFSPFLTSSLSTILVLVILTMRDLQNFRFTGGILVEESGQEVLEYIGKKRYYGEIYLADSAIPTAVKEYRIGIIDKKTGKKKIKLVKNR